MIVFSRNLLILIAIVFRQIIRRDTEHLASLPLHSSLAAQMTTKPYEHRCIVYKQQSAEGRKKRTPNCPTYIQGARCYYLYIVLLSHKMLQILSAWDNNLLLINSDLPFLSIYLYISIYLSKWISILWWKVSRILFDLEYNRFTV